MNALVISVFRYGCPLLINSNQKLISKLQTLLMKCTRHILGFNSYKMSTIAIIKELKFLTIQHLIVKESILFIHRVLFNQLPVSIFNLVTYGNDDITNVRRVRYPRMKIQHKSEGVRQSLLYRSIFLLNELGYEFHYYNPKKLSKYLQENIYYIFPHNKIAKQ